MWTKYNNTWKCSYEFVIASLMHLKATESPEKLLPFNTIYFATFFWFNLQFHLCQRCAYAHGLTHVKWWFLPLFNENSPAVTDLLRHHSVKGYYSKHYWAWYHILSVAIKVWVMLFLIESWECIWRSGTVAKMLPIL